MASSNLRQLFATVSLSLLVLQAAALPKCPDHSKADYDYVVVGAGVGGGPVAARLAQSGFSGKEILLYLSCQRFTHVFFAVLLVDAGHNVDTVNSTLPFYFARAAEGASLLCSWRPRNLTLAHADPQLELNYTYAEYSPGSKFVRNNEW